MGPPEGQLGWVPSRPSSACLCPSLLSSICKPTLPGVYRAQVSQDCAVTTGKAEGGHLPTTGLFKEYPFGVGLCSRAGPGLWS